jgi:small subunit ribosomal protein S9
MSIETKYKKVIAAGKRKEAIAKAVLTSGKGEITFNGQKYELLPLFDKLRIAEPLRIAEQVLGKIDFDAKITAQSGGRKGQIEAARLALAKGILKFSNSEELKQAYLQYDRNMLVADVRRKEAYKPGDSKARRGRQTSYR